MKENLILWVAAIVIVFSAAYFKSVNSPYYPVSGSFGIEGEKVTFKFDKLSRGEPYKVTLRTDRKDLSGHIEWKKPNQEWEIAPLKFKDGLLYAEIPEHTPFEIVYYQAVISYKDKAITIPRKQPVKLEYRNKISAAANGLYYFFFFAGLLLAVRSGLEYFRRNLKVKALAVFTLIFFTLYAFIFSPLRNSYEFGFMGDYIPKPDEIFLIKDIGYFLIWLAGFILLFAFKKAKAVILITSILLLSYFIITSSL